MKLVRLLIVDDEPGIADGLYDLLEDVRELELDLLKAYSGVEALEIMHRSKIDIVLTDICMPGISGIELQKEVRRQWPLCKFIFLTGYNEFEYIQQAIRNESIDYILKMEGDDAILRAVFEAAGRIDKELADTQRIQQAQDDRRRINFLLGGRFLQELAKGAPCTPQERIEQLDGLEIPLMGDKPILLLIGCVNLQDHDFIGRMKALADIQEVGTSILSASAHVAHAPIGNNCVLWLMQPCGAGLGAAEDRWKELRVFLHGCMDSIQTACRHVCAAPLTLAAADRPIPWEKLGQEYDRLKLALIKAGGLSNEALIIDAERKTDPSEPNDIKTMEATRAILKRASTIKSMVEAGHREDCQKLLREAFAVIGGLGGGNAGIAQELFCSVSLPFLTYINENRLYDAISADIGLESLIDLKAHNSLDDAADHLSRVCDCVFMHIREESSNNAGDIVRFVNKFIMENMEGDLSLTHISDLLHFNPSYFSRLFKSISETGYMDYVAGIKISLAKELLANKGRGINEIASDLGFDAPSAFSRFFKKRTSLSPQEYRESIRA